MAEAVLRPGEATRTMINVGVGGGTGLVEGLIIQKLAPATGALEPMVTWGTLLGFPVITAIAAMFTRGRTGDMFQAMAAGGSSIVGYTIPGLVQGLGKGRGGSPLEGQGVKQLAQGQQALGAHERAMAQARTGIEF